MNKQTFASPNLPPAAGPYSPAVIAGDLIFVSGNIPIDPKTGRMVAGPFEAHLRCVMENLKTLLTEAGSSLAQVVKVTVFLTDLDNFNTLNRVFEEYFPTEPPARSAVQVSRLPRDALVEVEVVALRA